MQQSAEHSWWGWSPATPTRLRLILLALSCVLVWMNPVSEAQTAVGGSFYVSPTGSDSNSGSLSEPWQTITHAALSTHAGDTIFLRGGVYRETEIWIRDSTGMGGIPGNFKTIQNYKGEQPVLQNQNGIYLSASWIRIQGIQFQGVGVNSNTWDGTIPNNIQIVGNSFNGATPGAAIDVVGDSLLINQNWIAMNSQPSNADSGIALHYGTNNVISGNYVSGTTGPGLYIHDESLSVYPAGAAASGYNNVVIASNVIKGSVISSGLVLSTGSNFAVQNVIINNNVLAGNYANGIDIETGLGIQVFNNTIYGNGADGILVVYPAPSYQMQDVQIENNILDDPCTQNCSSQRHVQVTNTGMSGFVLMDNLYWPQSIGFTNAVDSRPLYADPLFTNAAAGNFTLQAGSPAIDAGVVVGLPFNGSAPDLGAFESKATTPPVNDPPVVNAAANQTITLPSTATLPGSVTGVPAGTTATITWSKTSGPPSSPASPTIAWDPGSTSNLAGYNVYRSSQSGVFTSAPLNGSTLLTVPSFTDSTVQNGNTYYYAVRAVSTSGMESPNSNVIQVLR